MILGISEDFSAPNANLDDSLTSVPSSGLYLNTAVHPLVNVKNLLEFLPKVAFTITAWSNTTSYKEFKTSRNPRDVVSKDGKIYQCISDNVGQDPVSESTYWLETNLNSLRLKTFFYKVEDRVLSELSLERSLINNQYIYENGDQSKTLSGDYAGWVIQSKGSDYAVFRINSVSVQKDGITPVNLYVLKNDELVETITVTPDEGRVNFEETDITLSGQGVFKLVIDSTDVYTTGATIDPLRYNGVTIYSTIGTGDSPETATYTRYNVDGNGIGFNITAYLDPKVYIDNNLREFGGFIRSVFELMSFEMFLHNANNNSNSAQRNVTMNPDLLLSELKDMTTDSVVRRMMRARKKALALLERTFDTQLKGSKKDGLTVETDSY